METLADLLICGPLPPEHGARLGRDLARALARAEREGRWPARLSPELVEVDRDLRPIPGDLVERGPDPVALGLVLRALLGEGEPVPFVLRVIVMNAVQGRYRSSEEVARALDLWLRAQEPGRRRVPWVRDTVAPVRPLILAVGVVVTALGAAPLVRTAVEAPAEEPRSALVPPGDWPAPPVSIEVEGVALTRAEAEAVLAHVATATVEELRRDGLSAKAAAGVVERRPFGSVDALAAVPGVGTKSIQRLADATR
jgi:hypothetical protein